MRQNEKLRAIREKLGYNKNQFAVFLGVPNNYITQYEKPGAKVGNKIQNILKEKITNLNLNWFNDEESSNLDEMFYDKKQKQELSLNQIKVYGKVSAGKPLYVWDNEEFVMDISLPDFNKFKNKQLFGFEVKGDSMTPRFREGDILVTSKYELPDELPKDDDIVVTCFKNEGDLPEVNVKKFEWRNKKKNEFTLVPFNTYLRTSGHTMDKVMTMFKVLMVISKISYR